MTDIIADGTRIKAAITEDGAAATLSWHEEGGPEHHETYPTVAQALARLAVLEHASTTGRECSDSGTDRITRRIDAFLKRATMPRRGEAYPWHGWDSSKRVLRKVKPIINNG